MAYTAETRPNTAKTTRMLETAEMRTLRTIANKTIRDRIRSEKIREELKIDQITEWIKNRKDEWNEHVSRMDDSRLVKIARDRKPIGTRSIGHPRRRWRDNLKVDY